MKGLIKMTEQISMFEGVLKPNDETTFKRDVKTAPYIRRILPNKAFDQEYMTEWAREVKFLQDKDIRYVYVKKTPDYGISQFKYKKTPELFKALVEFYSQVEEEKKNIVSVDEAREALKGTGITIKHSRNGKIEFVKDGQGS